MSKPSPARLPMPVRSRGPEQVNGVVVSAGDQQRGVKVAGTNEMRLRQQVAACEVLMDDWRRVTISNRPRHCLNLRHEMGVIVLAGLGDMDLVADPLGGALFGEVGVEIMG